MGQIEREHKSFSRRDFGTVAFMSLLAGAMAACQRETSFENLENITSASTNTPTPLERKTQTPTSTKEPTATSTSTQTPEQTETASLVESIPFDIDQKIIVLEHHNPTYGKKGDEYQPVYMTLENYEEQLKTLKREGFYTPTETEILGWLDGKHGLPEKSAIIRIDIGVPFKDYEEGFRLLEKYGLKAILFIVTSAIPDKSSENITGWDFIKEYVDKGVLIPGSHGTYHPDYAEISLKDAMWDALNSKEIIEEKLERPVYFFAYPYDSEGHDEELLEHFKMLFGKFGSDYAFAGNPRVGTFYSYLKAGGFDWEKFNNYLASVSE